MPCLRPCVSFFSELWNVSPPLLHAKLVPFLETVPLDDFPPWGPPSKPPDIYSTEVFPLGDRQQRAVRFNAWLDPPPADHIFIFSEGSRLGSGRVSSGFISFQNKRRAPELQGLSSFSNTVEVPAAGILADLGGILMLKDLPALPSTLGICVYLDNLCVVATASSACASPTSPSANYVFQQFQQEIVSLLLPIHFRRCSGHCSIGGNETIELLSSTATTHPVSSPRPMTTFNAAKQLYWDFLWDKAQAAWCQWESETNGTYSTLLLPAAGPPKELSLLPKVLGHLIATRSRHGAVAGYHRHFNHSNTILERSCSAEKRLTIFCLAPVFLPYQH